MQEEFLNDGGIWEKFEEFCKAKDLLTIEKLINYYVNDSVLDKQA
jgi:hypothetical protein